MNSHREDKWSFFLISYCPKPEYEEVVNVGLLVTGPGQGQIIYDENFPKLRSIGTKDDKVFLQFTFDSLQAMSEQPDRLLEAFRSREPKFRVSQPHRLLGRPEPDLFRRLRNCYLAIPLPKEARKRSNKRRSQFEAELDSFLLGKFNLSQSCFRKNVDLKQLIAPQLWGNLPTRRHMISRCYIAKENLFLIDTVSLHGPIDQILSRADRINRSFWLYSKYSEGIRSLNDKIPFKIGLIFNGLPHPDKDVEEAHEFIRYQWNRTAEAVIDTDKEQDVEILGAIFANQSVGCTVYRGSTLFGRDHVKLQDPGSTIALPAPNVTPEKE